MRIALAIQSLNAVGGKERDALAIAGGLAARGHDVTILTRSARLPIPPGVALRRVDGGGWTNHGRARRFAAAVGPIAAPPAFDAVLTFDQVREADAYYAVDVCFAPRAHGLRGWLPRYATYARIEAECFGPGGPDILFLCRKQSDEYRLHYELAADRARILPPMLHDSGRRAFYERRGAIRARFGIPESSPLAVSVGVYPRQKGMDRSIAAVAAIPGLFLLCIGLKDPRAMTAQAARLGLRDRAVFSGHSDQVADVLGAGDLMLHPARIENTGLVILESLLAGVPVIASAACGFGEYVTRFGAGVVLPEPFDPAAFTATIRTALKPDTLAALRQRARDSAAPLRAEGGLDRILDAVVETLARHHARRTATGSNGAQQRSPARQPA